ncbi:MAG: S8 family serine peptidase [Kiloniellaceae bacterium]
MAAGYDDDGRRGLSIPPRLVEYLLLGPADDQRQLQDSPLLGDVWMAYAAAPARKQDLLITPHVAATAAQVAKVLATEFRDAAPEARAGIAYLQGLVAARLAFPAVLRHLVPMTQWWRDYKVPAVFEASRRQEELLRRMHFLLDPEVYTVITSRHDEGDPGELFRFLVEVTPLDRYFALAALILWAAGREPGPPGTTAPEEILADFGGRSGELFGQIEHEYRQFLRPQFETRPRDKEPGHGLVFQVSRNRRTLPALDRSVPAVKGDAAKTLFKVNCSKITWAILDSGIDTRHPALSTPEGTPRVRKSMDFTLVRDIISSDNQTVDVARLRALTGLSKGEIERHLKSLAKDADDERPVNWDVVEELITIEQPELHPPGNPHGTHVTGILGADPDGRLQEDVDADDEGPEEDDGESGYGSGMCPDIRLYDLRVLAKSIEDTEFAVIAALQYIRYLNDQHKFITIHGANLSLSIPHSVRNYACGRTPICDECERLVGNGVVVVAAAGNRGYQSFETKDGVFESYAAFSVTDPGNAEGVITVGATHGNWPHTYGVSFFSSRGPTGDGRQKPDLVAPGERVRSTVLNGEWGQESGTSMAAPHVSGAAAMLMARYPELVGQPRRIKQLLCDSATDLGRERSFQGHGMLDVLRAFQAI